MACKQVEELGPLQGQVQAVAPMEALLIMAAPPPAITATARPPSWVLEEQQPPQVLASSVGRLATGPVTVQVCGPARVVLQCLFMTPHFRTMHTMLLPFLICLCRLLR